ncbi:hypothetical protein Tco_0646703 [Tanacetum coccineum]
MFSTRIHHSGRLHKYPGKRYVDGHVDIFDMVDIDLFTVIALNKMNLQLGYTGEFEPLFYNYLRPLSTLDEGLYALACEEDVRCLATIVRSFKLVKVYIEHGFMVVNSYQRPPSHVRATIEDISEPGTNAIEYRSDKMLLFTWHGISTPAKDYFCDSVTSRCVPHGMLTPPTDESVITYTQLSGVQGVDTQDHVIEDVMRQLSFEETELDGEAE